MSTFCPHVVRDESDRPARAKREVNRPPSDQPDKHPFPKSKLTRQSPIGTSVSQPDTIRALLACMTDTNTALMQVRDRFDRLNKFEKRLERLEEVVREVLNHQGRTEHTLTMLGLQS